MLIEIGKILCAWIGVANRGILGLYRDGYGLVARITRYACIRLRNYIV